VRNETGMERNGGSEKRGRANARGFPLNSGPWRPLPGCPPGGGCRVGS